MNTNSIQARHHDGTDIHTARGATSERAALACSLGDLDAFMERYHGRSGAFSEFTLEVTIRDGVVKSAISRTVVETRPSTVPTPPQGD